MLFGGVYDWYDPSTLLDALLEPSTPDCEVLFVRSANREGTPQRVLAGVEAGLRGSDELRDRVEFIDWVPAERRFDLLRDVDTLVSLHRPGLETHLAFRTRFLDAAAAGCPIVATAGGAVSDMLQRDDAARLVPAVDPGAVAEALREVLAGGSEVSRRVERGRALAARFRWERVVEPLARFCQSPSVDPRKDRGRSGPVGGMLRALRRLRR